MAQGVIADNWSLQDISSLFLEGLDKEKAGEITIDENQHSYKPISIAVTQTEALFDFITDLVLRDEILVDEKFSDAWDAMDSPILNAKKLGVVRAYPFLSKSDEISEIREEISDRICSTKSLRVAHKENVDGWNFNKESPHQLLSQTLWGGAGMCARSYVYEKSYTPHPLRKRLFINSGFMLPADDAVHQVSNFLNDQKVKVSGKLLGNDKLFSTYINIPAIPIRILQESQSAEQMISIALQMRDDFQALRDWLKMFQNAISEEDTKTMIKYRKELDSVSQYIDKKIGYGTSTNPVSMEAGVGIFKVAIKGNPLDSLKNQFGIRATLNKLILGSSGREEIRKYVKMFGVDGSATAYEIENSFIVKG